MNSNLNFLRLMCQHLTGIKNTNGVSDAMLNYWIEKQQRSTLYSEGVLYLIGDTYLKT